jgi:hypothetical protein
MTTLNNDDNACLDELNKCVDDAISRRKDWLDSKMAQYAEFKIGDPIFDLDSSARVGFVTEYYRFRSDNDKGVWDTSLTIDYTFQTGGFDSNVKSFDNTSRQPRALGTKEQAELRASEKLDRLRNT